jgi:hypothetical protein
MISSDQGQDARATFPQNLCSACKELRRKRSNGDSRMFVVLPSVGLGVKFADHLS